MGVCNGNNNNKVENDKILIRMEKLRDELHNIVSKAKGSNIKAISKSQELDKLLNEYYKDNKNI